MGFELPLWNLYGPTEASIEVTWYEATHDSVDPDQTGFPIGYAGDSGVHMYVLDAENPSVLLEDGEVGEVCIGGVQVAYGYLDRPELTAERFLKNPHHPGLLYRTGDLGYVDKHGRLLYNGRADRQVKVGGVRMELGEIEAVALREVPKLLNVAVEKIGDALVGVAAPRSGEFVTAEEIKSVLATKLPSSYLPGEWIMRDSLPLGSAGKVDHKQVVTLISDQQTAAMWGSIYDEMYVRFRVQGAGFRVQGSGFRVRLTVQSSRVPHTVSIHKRFKFRSYPEASTPRRPSSHTTKTLNSYPATSLIPHPSSLIPHPSSLIPHRKNRYVADGLQVTDGVDDPTMDWAAYTDSFTGLMHEVSTKVLQKYHKSTRVMSTIVPHAQFRVSTGCGWRSCTSVSLRGTSLTKRKSAMHDSRVRELMLV